MGAFFYNMDYMISLIANLESKSSQWWTDNISHSSLIPILPLQKDSSGAYVLTKGSGEKRIQLSFERQYTPTGQRIKLPASDITLSTPGNSTVYMGGILVVGTDAKIPMSLTFTDNIGLTATLNFDNGINLKDGNSNLNTVEGINTAVYEGSAYPQGIDTYNIPSQPDSAYLSQNNNFPGSHAVSHQALNDSIYTIEQNAFVDNSATSHDHSDPYYVDYSQSNYMNDPSAKHGRQLRIQNTHITSDTNKAPTSEEAQSPDANPNTWHHTVVDPTSTATPTDYQAISWALWVYLGLSSLPEGYFKNQFPDMINALQNNITNNNSIIAGFAQSLQQFTDTSTGNLQAFNAYYDNRCNHFIGEYPANAIEFTPTSNISQVQSGGITTNYAQVDVFSRWAILHIHPFFSKHTGIDSQVMIYQQTPQSDGSIWCPNYEIFFPMAIEEQNANNPNENWSRDISWKPDGNIYTSSLGNPGEYDRVVNTIAKLPYNIQMLHKDSNGNIIQATNQTPFPTAS